MNIADAGFSSSTLQIEYTVLNVKPPLQKIVPVLNYITTHKKGKLIMIIHYDELSIVKSLQVDLKLNEK